MKRLLLTGNPEITDRGFELGKKYIVLTDNIDVQRYGYVVGYITEYPLNKSNKIFHTSFSLSSTIWPEREMYNLTEEEEQLLTQMLLEKVN